MIDDCTMPAMACLGLVESIKTLTTTIPSTMRHTNRIHYFLCCNIHIRVPVQANLRAN